MRRPRSRSHGPHWRSGRAPIHQLPTRVRAAYAVRSTPLSSTPSLPRRRLAVQIAHAMADSLRQPRCAPVPAQPFYDFSRRSYPPGHGPSHGTLPFHRRDPSLGAGGMSCCASRLSLMHSRQQSASTGRGESRLDRARQPQIAATCRRIGRPADGLRYAYRAELRCSSRVSRATRAQCRRYAGYLGFWRSRAPRLLQCRMQAFLHPRNSSPRGRRLGLA